MIGTGAITDAIVTREPAPPPMSEDEAIAAILEGHRAKAYQLPAPLIAAAEGAAAVVARATAVHNETNAAAAALSEGTGRLVADLVRQAATSGAIPKKLDPGAAMIELETALVRLRYEDGVYQSAAEKIETYPSTIARAIAGDVHAALDAALGELLAAARPHSAKIAALEVVVGADLAAYRADPEGYAALEALTGRLAAIEAAGGALARLGRAWAGLAGADGSPAVLRLARLAAAASTPAL